MPTLLIIDDEPNVLYSLERVLGSESLEIVTAGCSSSGLEALERARPDAVLLDIQLPDVSGLETLERIHEKAPKLPVIIMTAHGTAETAIEALKRGAFDYVLKPWNLSELRELVEQALEAGRLRTVPAVFDRADEPQGEQVDRIVGASSEMQGVFKEIGRIAPQDVNVLILGESGTGKELVARAIYYHSRRSEGPFLAINCAAIPETLLESELFGHEKGAFTGAERQRIGKFEQADGGTLFLDEIGDMAPATQAKMLRILQDGRFERVGGNTTINADVRIIAATNRNLEEAIADKSFRQDLFYRLNTFTIELPPLRERGGDIRRLAKYFLGVYGRKLSKQVSQFTPEAMAALEGHTWPGNVRELESAVKFAIVHAAGDAITMHALPDTVRDGQPGESSPVSDEEAAEPCTLREFVRELIDRGEGDLNNAVHSAVDRVLLEEILKDVDGNQTQAAERLGVSRTTLRARLNQLGLSIGKEVRTESEGAPTA